MVRDRMKDDKIIDEIIADLPLKERTLIANMAEYDIEILQSVFELNIQSKVNEAEDQSDIFNKLCRSQKWLYTEIIDFSALA